MARGPDRLRAGQPRPRDHAGGREGRAARRHHGDGPLGLSQPGQQRPRLPVHLPRRARRAGHGDQRGDEAGRLPGPGGARQDGRAGLGVEGLRRPDFPVRPRVPDSQALRSAGAPVGRPGGGRSGHEDGRGARADHGHGRLSAPARGDALALERGDERRAREGAAGPEAHRVSGGRAPQDPAGRQDPGRGRDLPAGPARPRGRDREARPRPRAADGQDRFRQHQSLPEAAGLRAPARGAAPAARA